MNPTSSYQGARVIITGGSSGLGQALALELARQGARVVAIARGRERLEHALKGSGVHTLVADIADKDAIHRISAEALDVLGGVDLLINNASSLGPVPLRPLIETECEEVEDVLQTNLLGPFRLSKALLGHMLIHGGGTVVNISSDAAVNPYGEWGAYSLSKAALDHMTKIWAAELGERGIQFLSIDPGDMATPMHFAAIPGANADELYAPTQVAAQMASFIDARPKTDPHVRFSAQSWRNTL